MQTKSSLDTEMMSTCYKLLKSCSRLQGLWSWAEIFPLLASSELEMNQVMMIGRSTTSSQSNSVPGDQDQMFPRHHYQDQGPDPAHSCHTVTATACLLNKQLCKILDLRTKHWNPPVIAIHYCFDSHDTIHLQHLS